MISRPYNAKLAKYEQELRTVFDSYELTFMHPHCTYSAVLDLWRVSHRGAAMTPEARVKNRVKELLEPFNAYTNWPVPAGYGTPMLDCVGCVQGYFFAIETKAPGQKLTPRQQYTREQMEAAGAKVFVIGEKSVENDPGTWYSGEQELLHWLNHVKRSGEKRP